MVKLHIRKGDSVKVLSGKYKGDQGVVLKVYPKLFRALVKGVNIVHKCIKSSPSESKPGGIRKQEASVHVSNLMLIEPTTGQATRVGRKLNEMGKLIRYSKKTGNFINNVSA